MFILVAPITTKQTNKFLEICISNGLEVSPHVAELSYTVQMWAASKRIAKEDIQYLKGGELNIPFTLGINSFATYPGLSGENVSFIDGYGPEVFDGDEAVCIVRSAEMEKYNLKPGDSNWFTLFYISYPNDTAAFDCKWLGEYEVKISQRGIALTVNDETFIRAGAVLRTISL